LARAGVTKGAFFHHFPSKTAFGYAVVDEVLAAMITAQWADPLREAADPLETIAAEYQRGIGLLGQQQPILGCPLNNLAQEMNPLDAGFRTRIQAVFAAWHAAFRQALQGGQQRGTLRAGLDASDTAHALVAQIEGTLSLARNSQNPDDLTAGCRSVRQFWNPCAQPRPPAPLTRPQDASRNLSSGHLTRQRATDRSGVQLPSTPVLVFQVLSGPRPTTSLASALTTNVHRADWPSVTIAPTLDLVMMGSSGGRA
jgi:TetR/AcrR family transcriptional regulator, transcriptional repressor for nem operon